MGKYYVYSTLTAGGEYTGWIEGAGGLPKRAHSVKIAGGANLYNKNLITPLGVVTEISEEDEAFLRGNKIFQIHEKNGFVRIDSKKRDIEAAVADMERRDASAPDVPQDYVEVPAAQAGNVTGIRRNRRAKRQ
ncbi:MAG: hypothetical protein LBJ76_03285 [Candidatus Accumulibacter sp.]|jgi:hypothetical protein|nr:hypothetical protein [Accumulibacter sp.]